MEGKAGRLFLRDNSPYGSEKTTGSAAHPSESPWLHKPKSSTSQRHGSRPGFLLSVPRSVGSRDVGKHRFRLRRKSMLFGDERFFYLRPPLIDPPFHFLRIALFGSLGWPPQSPVDRPRDLPHLSRVIMNTRQTLDNDRHAGKGPQLGFKPVGPCSHSQGSLDTSQLLRF